MVDELSQYRVFRESLETADEYLRSSLRCTWSAAEELRREAARSKLDLPAYSQPLCTILQIALVDLLESWNIVPSVMAGSISPTESKSFVLLLTLEMGGTLANLCASRIASSEIDVTGRLQCDSYLLPAFGGTA
jgi:acyl transferase domain-containing protein